VGTIIKALTAASLFILLTACGGGGGNDPKDPSTEVISGGDGTDTGSGDGSPPPTFAVDQTARLTYPGSLTADNDGNLYVVDRGNDVIRKVAATGEVNSLSVVIDGSPIKLAAGRNGNLFMLTNRKIYRITADGQQELLATYALETSMSLYPIDIASDTQGNIYVLEGYTAGNAILRIDPDKSTHRIYSFPTYVSVKGFAFDSHGNLAIHIFNSSYSSNFLFVPKSEFLPNGSNEHRPIVTALPYSGEGNIVLDSSGNVYMVTTSYSGTRGTYYGSMPLRKIGSDGTVVALPCPREEDCGMHTLVQHGAASIAMGADDTLYLSDPFNHAIYKYSQTGQWTLVAGKPGEPGNSD
jgi:hypothetical protein